VSGNGVYETLLSLISTWLAISVYITVMFAFPFVFTSQKQVTFVNRGALLESKYTTGEFDVDEVQKDTTESKMIKHIYNTLNILLSVQINS